MKTHLVNIIALIFMGSIFTSHQVLAGPVPTFVKTLLQQEEIDFRKERALVKAALEAQTKSDWWYMFLLTGSIVLSIIIFHFLTKTHKKA